LDLFERGDQIRPPRPNFASHQWGVVINQWGVKPPNPPTNGDVILDRRQLPQNKKEHKNEDEEEKDD